MLVNLRNIFAPQAVAQSMTALPDLKSTVLDTAFPDRPVHPFSVVGLSELTAVTGTVPVVRRGGAPVTVGGDGMDVTMIAPQPVKPAIEVTAAELNDLKMIMGNAAALTTWREAKIDTLRRLVRQTTEAMAAGVLYLGKVEWPQRRNGGGTSTYTVDYGAPLSHTLGTPLSAASKVSALYELLMAMRTKIRQAGIGGTVAFHAGSDVFRVILDICQGYTSTAGGDALRVELASDQGVVKIGGFSIMLMDETYQDPITGEWTPKLGAKKLVAYATDAPGKVWYCAIDSVTATNLAVPFYVVPEMMPGDAGIRLIAQSKPLPARNSKTVCVCTAVA